MSALLVLCPVVHSGVIQLAIMDKRRKFEDKMFAQLGFDNHWIMYVNQKALLLLSKFDLRSTKPHAIWGALNVGRHHCTLAMPHMGMTSDEPANHVTQTQHNTFACIYLSMLVQHLRKLESASKQCLFRLALHFLSAFGQLSMDEEQS